MGCVFSCRPKPKKTKASKGNQIQPISNSDLWINKTNFDIFRVKEVQVQVENENVGEPKTLEDGGLVSKNTVVSSKGVSYSIEESTLPSAPPTRLTERFNSQIQQPSTEDIKNKLLQAERRRKQLEEERIVKVKEMQKTETPTSTINAFIHRQKLLEDQQTKKMDDAVASRQARLRLIRDRLKEKDDHAKSVRQRKFLGLDDMGPPPREERIYSFHNSG